MPVPADAPLPDTLDDPGVRTAGGAAGAAEGGAVEAVPAPGPERPELVVRSRRGAPSPLAVTTVALSFGAILALVGVRTLRDPAAVASAARDTDVLVALGVGLAGILVAVIAGPRVRSERWAAVVGAWALVALGAAMWLGVPEESTVDLPVWAALLPIGLLALVVVPRRLTFRRLAVAPPHGEPEGEDSGPRG